MTIVRMWGGLGNQMFIYAYYRSLQEQGIDARMDLSWFEQFGNSQHGYSYLLPEIFNRTKSIYATGKECSRYAIFGMDPISRIFRRVGINKSGYLSQTKDYKSAGFNHELTCVENKYIEGYFQSELYFKHIKEILRQEFSFQLCDEIVNKYLEKISCTTSISIHIRRGDYVRSGVQLLCDSNYYEHAIEYIHSCGIANPVFFVFSDDIEWCRDKFSKFFDSKFIFVTDTINAQQDMYLMSRCKHNIIANSTFSWWGAWLNSNPDKIVIAPDKWNDSESFSMEGIVPEKWIRIKR